jgi:hypothetical protein
MFVCFDKEVGWCVGIAEILVCREGVTRRSRWIERLRRCWEEESQDKRMIPTPDTDDAKVRGIPIPRRAV